MSKTQSTVLGNQGEQFKTRYKQTRRVTSMSDHFPDRHHGRLYIQTLSQTDTTAGCTYKHCDITIFHSVSPALTSNGYSVKSSTGVGVGGWGGG